MNSFELAHLSDLHTTEPRFGPDELSLKRALAWLAWRRRRRGEHCPEVVARALADLRDDPVDHLVVSGDLTNLGTRAEVAAAESWLRESAPPDALTLVPGNHDAYVWPPAGEREGWERWAPWIASDPSETSGIPMSPGTRESFPTLRRRGPIALVGLCSVHPTSLLTAEGTLGAGQIAALSERLRSLREEGLCRVVVLHHPPLTAGGEMRRRRLRDARALQAVLAEVGAELVLHGHMHRTHVATLPGPDGPIPVVGPRSGSARGGHRPAKRASYHRYRIRRAGDGRWSITLQERHWDPERDRFVAIDERALS